METTTLKEFGRFGYFESQRELFKSGQLWKLWYEQYPNLFDDKQLQWAHGQAKYGYHFFEWMGKILLHTATGYLPMGGNEYRIRPQNRKTQQLEKTVSPEALDLIEHCLAIYHCQAPDLLMYAPDYSDYFFCEVKGNSDRLSQAQLKFYLDLQSTTGKPVYILYFFRVKQRGSGMSGLQC